MGAIYIIKSEKNQRQDVEKIVIDGIGAGSFVEIQMKFFVVGNLSIW